MFLVKQNSPLHNNARHDQCRRAALVLPLDQAAILMRNPTLSPAKSFLFISVKTLPIGRRLPSWPGIRTSISPVQPYSSHSGKEALRVSRELPIASPVDSSEQLLPTRREELAGESRSVASPLPQANHQTRWHSALSVQGLEAIYLEKPRLVGE